MKKSLIILVAVLIFLVYGCSMPSGGESVPDISSSSDTLLSEEQSEAYEVDQKYIDKYKEYIIELLDRDKTIIDIFVNGSLSAGQNYDPESLEYIKLESGTVYDDFNELTGLLRSTYSSESAESFINYPEYGLKSLTGMTDGTYFSVHNITEFNESIDLETMIFKRCDDRAADIKCSTVSGKPVELSFINTSSGWRMEQSLFFYLLENSEYPDWDQSPYYTGAMNSGSCKVLAGSCLVINVFLDDSESVWNDELIINALEMVNTGLSQVTVWAGEYGVEDLELEITDLTTSLRLTTGEKVPTDTENIFFAWIDQLFLGTIYHDLQGYAEQNFETADYDNYCVLFHLNKQGRSYTVPSNRESFDHDFYYTERAVLFYSVDPGYEYYMVPAIYAHEFLHLFGADDLYSPFLEGYEYKLIESIFYNEIMFRIPTDVSDAAVSPYTAFKVGWRGNMHSQFAKIADKVEEIKGRYY